MAGLGVCMHHPHCASQVWVFRLHSILHVKKWTRIHTQMYTHAHTHTHTIPSCTHSCDRGMKCCRPTVRASTPSVSITCPCSKSRAAGWDLRTRHSWEGKGGGAGGGGGGGRWRKGRGQVEEGEVGKEKGEGQVGGVDDCHR